MALSSAIVAELVAAGLSGDALVAACARIEASSPAVVDEQAARRREADRIRKAEKRAGEKAERLRTSADSADICGQPSRDIQNAPTHAEPEPNITTYPTTSEANASSVEPQPADLPLTGELIFPIAKPKPPPNAARGCRLPPGFPGDDEREWTRSNLRFTDDDFERCRDEFRDYWSGVPGQRGVKCDWPATFRNAARKYRPSGGSRQAYASGNQRSDGSLLGAYQRAASRVRASNDVSRQRAGVFDHRDGELGMHYGIPAE